eukprot:6207085-Pleurochrysis_carterae.AAC.6
MNSPMQGAEFQALARACVISYLLVPFLPSVRGSTVDAVFVPALVDSSPSLYRRPLPVIFSCRELALSPSDYFLFAPTRSSAALSTRSVYLVSRGWPAVCITAAPSECCRLVPAFLRRRKAKLSATRFESAGTRRRTQWLLALGSVHKTGTRVYLYVRPPTYAFRTRNCCSSPTPLNLVLRACVRWRK